MTLEQIKAAVKSGQRVCWAAPNYVVACRNDVWTIRCTSNGHCIGLTWADDVTINGKEEDFYIDKETTE